MFCSFEKRDYANSNCINMIWQKFLSYINIFGKRQPGAKGNINLTLMHGINRISIFLFLFAVIYWLIRFVF
jgi:hypothetical protein